MASDLSTELRRRAEETSEAIAADAREEAARLIAEANELVEARRSKVLRSKEEAYRSKARADIAAARHEAMRAVLLAKTRIADRILEAAKARLEDAARSEPYLAALSNELEKALAFVGEDGAVVRCSRTVESSVRDVIGARANLRIERLTEGATGFVAIGADGSVRVDGTLETRLERMRAALSIEIHKLLEEP